MEQPDGQVGIGRQSATERLNMSTEYKAALAILLFMAWGGLVMNGLAPAADFVTALRDALIGLGVFHAALTKPGEAP